MICRCHSGFCPRCRKPCFSSRTVRNCRVPGLGDRVAAALSALGITKERVSQTVGGDCGCQKRQEKLNRWGRWLGLG
jgi:hypothetical protein